MTNVEYLIKHSFINDSHSNTAIYIHFNDNLGCSCCNKQYNCIPFRDDLPVLLHYDVNK